MTQLGTVYLLHFDRPFKHARHYLGWTGRTVVERGQEHMDGNGSKLMRAVRAAGIAFEVVRTWERVDRHFERKLHRRKCSPRLCPVCSSERT